MKQPIELLDVTGVATANATGTTTVRLPGGYRYHSLQLVGSAVTGLLMAANYGDHRLRYGGRIQRLSDVTEHDSINGLMNPPSAVAGTPAATPYSVYNNVNPGPFVLPNFFSEPWRQQYAAMERFALDVLPDEDVTYEVDFKSVATAPVARFRAIVEDLGSVQASGRQLNRVVQNGRNLPTISKHFRTTRGAAGTSMDIVDLNRQDVYQHIRLYNPTGAEITAAEVRIDGKTVFKRTKTENDAELRALGMNPAAPVVGPTGYFDIVPDASDNPADGWNLAGVGKFEIGLTFSATASGVVKVITHRWGLPE